MPIQIPRTLVDRLLLGPDGDRRQLQDSPVLGDVWIAFAETPGKASDLLITPLWRQPAAEVATSIDDRIARTEGTDPAIACLSNLVAAHLTFDGDAPDRCADDPVVALDKRSQSELRDYLDPTGGSAKLDRTIAAARAIANALAEAGAHATRACPAPSIASSR